MSKDVVLALDLGTTSAKAVLFNTEGKLIAEAEKEVTSHYPHKDWVEQDPDDIERAAVTAIQTVMSHDEVNPSHILGVGLSCAMHSLICVDENFAPLSRAMIWADGRSHQQARALKQNDGHVFYKNTGMPTHTMSPFTKLLWMKENDFEPYQKAAYFVSVKEYILQKWFNHHAIDYAMASATGLFNIHTFDWDTSALDLVGVKRNQLSKIVPPTEIFTHIHESIAREMGISDETPFVIGSADGQLANLGSGAISPGEVAISAGTSGAIRQMVEGFPVSDNEETFCYAFTENLSIVGGPTNNGGIALQWVKELLGYEGTFEAFIEEASDVAPGADGLLFHPYINGERAPLWNQHARGNFFGISVTHQEKHFIRAVLEGIVYNLYHIGQVLADQIGQPEKITVNGGLARSPIWNQILADVFGQEICVQETHHSAAWGAAWTALVALEKAQSFEQIKENIHIEKVIRPDENKHQIYMQYFETYKMLSRDLATYF